MSQFLRPPIYSSWISSLAFGLCLLAVTKVPAQIEDLSVEELIEQLKDDDLELRRDAVYELVKRQATEDAVILALAKLTDDRDDQIQFQALMGLARAGANAVLASDELIERLDENDDQVRYRASVALGKIGKGALPNLLEAWNGESARQQAEIARAIALMGPVASKAKAALFEGLESGDENVRRFSAEAIHSIASTSEKTLLQLAAHQDETVRRVGISALASLPEPSSAVAERLTQALGDDNAKIRETAILALGKSALSPEEKADFILDALSDSELAVREAAIVTIDNANLRTASFAASLGKMLNRTQPAAIRSAIIKSLAVVGTEARDVLPELLQFAGEQVAEVNEESREFQLLAQSIASVGGESVEQLLEAIDGQPALKSLISESLALIGPDVRDSLIEALSSERLAVRETAVQAIGATRPLDGTLVNYLLDAIEDVAPQVRRAAVEALVDAGGELGEQVLAEESSDQQAGQDDIPPLKRLLEAFNDPNASVRSAALGSLAVFDFPAEVIQSSLSAALEEPETSLKLAALQTIDAKQEIVSDYLEQIIELTADEEATVRGAALRTLRHLDRKETGEAVQQAIVAGLRDQESSLRAIATDTVSKLRLSSQSVLDALSDNLGPDVELLRATLEAIEKAGPQAKSLIPAVSQLIDHDDESVRKAAVSTYAKIEANESSLTGRMMDALNDSSWTVRGAAAEQLANIGPAAKAAVPRLFELLSSDDDSDSASNAIREIDAAPPEAIPLFMEELDSKDRRTGFYAIFLLGKVGPAASEALPKLEAKLEKIEKDGGSEFRTRFLKQAIASIKGEDLDDQDDD